MAYITVYTSLTVLFLFMAWVNDYSFLPIPESFTATQTSPLDLPLFTIFGALLGGSTLSITSLHKYTAVTKTLDIDHLWGYLMAPILSIIIGILIFCLLYSGMMVLSGGFDSNTNAHSSMKIGYLSLGAICSYNWDVFILKLQRLSSHVTDETSRTN